MAAFLALAAFALGHWMAVLVGAPAWRAVALLAVCGVVLLIAPVVWIMRNLDFGRALSSWEERRASMAKVM